MNGSLQSCSTHRCLHAAVSSLEAAASVNAEGRIAVSLLCIALSKVLGSPTATEDMQNMLACFKGLPFVGVNGIEVAKGVLERQRHRQNVRAARLHQRLMEAHSDTSACARSSLALFLERMLHVC
jgi:hypothetical protein